MIVGEVPHFVLGFGGLVYSALWGIILLHTYVRGTMYICREYLNVCPFVRIGSHFPSLASECAHPRNQRGGGANSYDWRESLALCTVLYTLWWRPKRKQRSAIESSHKNNVYEATQTKRVVNVLPVHVRRKKEVLFSLTTRIQPFSKFLDSFWLALQKFWKSWPKHFTCSVIGQYLTSITINP